VGIVVNSGVGTAFTRKEIRQWEIQALISVIYIIRIYYTGLLKITVLILTTCHTQYT